MHGFDLWKVIQISGISTHVAVGFFPDSDRLPPDASSETKMEASWDKGLFYLQFKHYTSEIRTFCIGPSEALKGLIYIVEVWYTQ